MVKECVITLSNGLCYVKTFRCPEAHTEDKKFMLCITFIGLFAVCEILCRQNKYIFIFFLKYEL